MRTGIQCIQFLIILFFCSGEVVAGEEAWLGNYVGDRIPLRETLDSRYVVVSVTGSQADLNERIFVANRQLRFSCLKDQGHALINIRSSVTIADVVSSVEKGVVFEKGVLVLITADCVIASRLLDPKTHVLP